MPIELHVTQQITYVRVFPSNLRIPLRLRCRRSGEDRWSPEEQDRQVPGNLCKVTEKGIRELKDMRHSLLDYEWNKNGLGNLNGDGYES